MILLSIQIANSIRPLRKLKGWTLEELSSRSGVGRANLGHTENGDTLPRLDTAFLIAFALSQPICKVFRAKCREIP